MQPAVLVLNCGSSSLKYSLVEPDPGTSVAHGIGREDRQRPCHGDERQSSPRSAANAASLTTTPRCVLTFEMFAEAGGHLEPRPGRGGPPRGARRREFYRPTVVDDAGDRPAGELSPLAPCIIRPACWGSRWPAGCCPTCPRSRCSTPAFFHDLPPTRRPPTRSTARSPRHGASAGMVSRHLAPVRQRAGRGVPRVDPAGI